MKYKVGDKVKINNGIHNYKNIYTIEKIYKGHWVGFEETSMNALLEDLEKVNYLETPLWKKLEGYE